MPDIGKPIYPAMVMYFFPVVSLIELSCYKEAQSRIVVSPVPAMVPKLEKMQQAWSGGFEL
jgi:hypothetical protein